MTGSLLPILTSVSKCQVVSKYFTDLGPRADHSRGRGSDLVNTDTLAGFALSSPHCLHTILTIPHSSTSQKLYRKKTIGLHPLIRDFPLTSSNDVGNMVSPSQGPRVLAFSLNVIYTWPMEPYMYACASLHHSQLNTSFHLFSLFVSNNKTFWVKDTHTLAYSAVFIDWYQLGL